MYVSVFECKNARMQDFKVEKTPVRDFYLKIFGGFRIIAYICNMKTKNLYINIGLSMCNTLIINVLPPLFVIGKLQMQVIV